MGRAGILAVWLMMAGGGILRAAGQDSPEGGDYPPSTAARAASTYDRDQETPKAPATPAPHTRPAVSDDVRQYYLAVANPTPTAPGVELVYRPRLLAGAEVLFIARQKGLEYRRQYRLLAEQPELREYSGLQQDRGDHDRRDRQHAPDHPFAPPPGVRRTATYSRDVKSTAGLIVMSASGELPSYTFETWPIRRISGVELSFCMIESTTR